MTALVTVAGLETIGLCAGMFTLATLRRSWGLDEHGSATAQALRMLLPRPDRGTQAVYRALLRQIIALHFTSATGEAAAYGIIRCAAGPCTVDALRAFYGAELEAVLADRYVLGASRQGWRMPLDGVRVLLEVDERFQEGWTRPVGTPTALANSRRQVPETLRKDKNARVTTSRDNTVNAKTKDLRTLHNSDVANVTLEPLSGGASLYLQVITGRRVTVGRAGGCDVLVDAPLVSRRHATLLLEAPGMLVVEDAGASNGLFVDGVRCRRAELSDGSFVTPGAGGPSFRVVIE